MSKFKRNEVEILAVAMQDLVQDQWKRVAESMDMIDQSNRHKQTGEMIITHAVNANYSRAIEIEMVRDKVLQLLEVGNVEA